eukprot:augustus_masked-scaffold_3-processed-gene-12.4-mRNA-1 protein AED:0.01 eAED:0.04 QI:0/-1/0/1/-1/1/1/0/501
MPLHQRSISNRIKALDMYRKIPTDLTTPTVLGGSCSLISIGLLFVLVIWELQAFFKTKYTFSIEVDHSEDAIIQLNLNLTLPGLSCEYATVDLENVLGEKKHDIRDRTLHKFDLEGNWEGQAGQKWGDNEFTYDVDEGSTDLDHYGNKRYALELTHENFDKALHESEVLVVDFHAPWCGHCQRLSPIYEHAAHIVQEKRPNRARERRGKLDKHGRHSVALATFDCTIPDHVPTCRKFHIQGFPTILVFRQSQGEQSEIGQHESYHGIRKAETIADWALKVYDDVQSNDEALKDGLGPDADGDEIPDSKVRTRGCKIEGFLMMQKVPTRVIIRPHSNHHALNTSLISVDHKINHLSFGRRDPDTLLSGLDIDELPGAYDRSKAKAKKMSSAEQDEVGFISPGGIWTHEHYLKVVSTTLVHRFGLRQTGYEYTINSVVYKSPIPEIVIGFDLSPMKVYVKEEPRNWIEGIVGIMALIGGVFTCSTLFESMFEKAVDELAKKLD